MKKRKMIFLLIFLVVVFLLPVNVLAFKVSWTASTGEVNGYIIYYSPDLQEVLDKNAPSVDVDASRTSVCIEPDFNEYSVAGFFVGGTAYNDAGESDMSNIAYVLFGNIYGNDWDGVPAADARVDGQDLNIIGFYYGQPVSHQEIDCDSNFVLENPDLRQRADLCRDANNRIDMYDVFKFLRIFYLQNSEEFPPWP